MDLLTSTLAFNNGESFWVIGAAIAIVAILCGSVCSIHKTRARERSRSEIAAYIAEGSMTPEEGERLMMAGEDND